MRLANAWVRSDDNALMKMWMRRIGSEINALTLSGKHFREVGNHILGRRYADVL